MAPTAMNLLASPTTRLHFDTRTSLGDDASGSASEGRARALAASEEPRQIHTRAMGRPRPGLEVRVVDSEDRDVPTGESGEMLVRHSAETPRRAAFSGYLNLPEATEEAWRGGWFHTGDVVSQDETGMLYFVDRKKNIIRRSGENVSGEEVEDCIRTHPAVLEAAVIPVPDPIRGEEVKAYVQLKAGGAVSEAEIVRWCDERLSDFKVPRYVEFREQLPVTGARGTVQRQVLRQEDGLLDCWDKTKDMAA